MIRKEAEQLKFGDRVVVNQEGQPDSIMSVCGLTQFKEGSDDILLAYI